VKPAPFELVRPASLDEALEVLAASPDAKVLAGGQSLVPLLSMRLASPGLLVDINGIGALAYVRVSDDGVRVGALARHTDVLQDEEAARVQPLLRKALRLVAHPTIRNRGTTVGSVVHADASAEVPAVLALLDGHVTAASVRGRREIPVGELYVGPMESSLRPDEVAVEAWFPALPAGTGTAVEEVARRHGDYALCGVAAAVRPGTSARVSYFSVCDVPTAVDVSPALAGGLSEDALAEAGELALHDLDPQEDIHATADYRRQLVRVLTARALRAAWADASGGEGR
jgi:CO/xanthine dehydrogenase FAD-binding subunit